MRFRAFNGLFANIGIQPRLVVFVALAAVPFIVLTLAHDLRERAGAVARALQDNARLSLIAAGQEKGLILEAQTLLTALQAMAAIGTMLDPDPSECHAVLKQIVERWAGANAIGMVDRDGRMVCHSMFEQPEPYGDQAFFRQVVATDAPAFQLSRFHTGRLSGLPSIVLARRLEQGRGMVFVSLTLALFAQPAARIERDPGTEVVLVDGRDGTILASDPPLSLTAAASLLPAFRASPGGGVAAWDAAPGVRMVTGFSPLLGEAADGLMVLAATPRRTVIAKANRQLWQDLAVLMAVLAATSGLAWLAGGVFLRPLRALGDAAERLGASDHIAPVALSDHAAPEFRALAATLETNAERLQRTEARNRAMLQELARSEAAYRQLTENVSDVIVRLDVDLVRRYVSPACRTMLGYEPEELVGGRIAAIVHPDDAPLAQGMLQSLLDGAPQALLCHRLCHRDGRVIWAEVKFQRLLDGATGALLGLVGVLRDISDRREAAAAIEASEARYQLLAEHITDLVLLMDQDGNRRYVSPSVTRLLGYTPEEFARFKRGEVIHPDDIDAVTQAYHQMAIAECAGGVVTRFRYRHKNGSSVWVEGIGRRTEDGSGFVSTVRDLTHRLEIEERLAEANRRLETLASQDGLTGLANRRRFAELLPSGLRRAARARLPVSLLMVDVDRFKLFNDTYGHLAGDNCLRDIANALMRTTSRGSDLVVRYGGEEIAVLLPDTAPAMALEIAETLRRTVRDLGVAHAASEAGVVTVSIGVATIYPSGRDEDEPTLIAAADRALYLAKSSGRDCVRVADALRSPPTELLPG